MFNKTLFSTYLLVTALLPAYSFAGGAGRPTQNPFEDRTAGDFESFAKTKGIGVLNLAFTSNVASKLGPCGCSINPKGGVDRRHNFIESIKPMYGSLLVVDAGNAFFASRTLDPSLLGAQQERALKIAKAHQELGVLAQNVGIVDFAAGLEFLKKIEKTSGLKLISTNLVYKKQGAFVFDESLVQQIPGIGKVLIVGVTSKPDQFSEPLNVLDPLESIQNQISKHKPQMTVVLSDLGQSEDIGLMSKLKAPTVFVGSRDLNSLDLPVHSGSGFLVQPGIQGQQVGLIRVAASKGFEGWRNLTQDKAFAIRWNQLAGEQEYLKTLEASEDRTRSLKKVEDSFVELKKFAKTSIENSWPYTYELFDLDEKYKQKNKFTVLSLEDQ